MSFERLRVYQAAELLVQCVTELLKSVPPGHAKDVDQLKRASSSIPYNIAEAFGSEHPGQKVYHLGIARGSADETRAVLRRFVANGVFRAAAVQRPTVLTVTVAKMLTAWIDQIGET